MRFKINGIIRHVFSIAIIIGLGFYLWKHWGVFSADFGASWYHIVILVSCILFSWMTNSCQILLITKQMGVKIGFLENLLLFIATALGNYLPMRIGTILRMRYLNRVHGMDYITFGGLVSIRTIIFLASTGILGAIGMIGLKLSGHKIGLTLLFIFTGMVILPMGICLIPTPKIFRPESFLSKTWSQYLIGIKAVQKSPILLWQNIGLVFLQYLLLAVRLYITFDIVQVKLSLWSLLILAPFTTLISFISLTPGNLGLREWAIGVISLTLGIDFKSGIFAGSIDRAILMACTFIFGSFALIFVWYRINNIKD